ncbi:flagellar hook protein FlgE [Sinorhizobium meliloti]|jgi:flagellar hook protein FlgE|uniref:Flagellar hook protein FlgE n=1 Tax=Rhizobium meliloti (strain 1021) TaxID=266834 RepID=FLGE_RHIME|nr:flagellar hook protein FlgE [Sinorhizobium meliloti]Q9X5Y0.2 RecName: Full=Flagellar hook protein FlgE [Sinorhizobium meliloti 1021]TWA89454.1 flagellar hook protein FlgE [Ensifer sp. SEMIA 134]TWB25571.1 flagellar hook protein FlgE [Ensifer sp. SEMIA 135]AEG03230.1 flagellar hook-basal body protein [Sinorhizobium meliloti BL225C]AGG73259.1 Flagellar hook protein [Sinorhizobium meliloti 2011]AIL98504.1 flagellar hook protein FlgE [Sinorhizobium meliloti]
MSLYGTMRTGVSGMNAQSNRLSTVAENIANANTTGYKRASTEFSSMILPSGNGSYNSGGVQTEVRYSISQQGATTFTTSASDLAIDGGGFFIVEGANGQEYLTRAGSFVPDSEGNLVNASGFTLMGYEYEAGVDPTVVVNGFDGLTRVNLASDGLIAAGSTKGSMGANLPSGAPVGDVSTTSLVVYDSQGNTRILDFNYEKTGANAWTLEIVDRASGDALTVPPVTLAFNAAGELTTSPATVVANGALIVPPPATGAVVGSITIDFSKTTQLGYAFNADGGSIDGNAPSKVAGYQIDSDGIVYVKYENGKLDPRYRIALANVQSPDKLRPESGNVYSQGVDSGVIITGFAGSGDFGEILSGALESSNVDIAEELTAMIESQRNYTANSKVFQTGSELLEVLVNLKR